MVNSQTKAYIVTIFFCFALLVSIVINKIDWAVSLPLIIFYLMITLNTFFSIRTFSSIIPAKNIAQNFVDIILMLSYLVLAFSITNPLRFVICVITLFTVATLKYLPLLSSLPYPRLLMRKILIDISGIVMGLAVLTAVLMNYTFYASWSLAIIFSLANLCLLFIWPMYRIENQPVK